MASTDVRLLEAWKLPEAQTFFRNVWPMYVHDIAGFDTDFYRLDATGRWLPDIVEDWVAPETPVALLHRAPTDEEPAPRQRCHVIAAGSVNVGFVCVALPPFKYMPQDADVLVGEFFIASPFRGRGIARRSIELLVPRYRGRWYLSAIHDNARAIRFWQKTLPTLPIRELRESAEARELCFSFVT